VETPSRSQETRTTQRRRALRWLLAGGLVLLLAARVAAVFTANVHWDEFALLHLADVTQTTGVLQAGGRAGLAVAMLVPFVADCSDEVDVIRRARLLWIGITAVFLAGLAVWIAQLAPAARGRWRDAALGLALLALLPAFLDSSLQVRSDHIALAGGAWGGAALLASRQRPLLALAAGALFATGFLGSQKVLYLGALAALLAGAQLVLARELRPRREGVRALLGAAGFGAIVLAFQAWTQLAFEVPTSSPTRQPLTASYVDKGLSLFEYYRNTLGFSQYRELLPSLAPHFLLLAGLAAASLRRIRRRGGEWERLALAWAVLLLGVAVGLFHAAAFRYFWMTLGLFPAIAFAIAREPILGLLQAATPRARRLAVAGFCLLLALPGVMTMGFLLTDAQAVQRESLGFVHRNFRPEEAGFHPESGLFCQAGRQPIPTHFSQHIYQLFAGASRERNTERMIQTFRETPIRFIVQSFRLNQFPLELRRFWAANYQPYRASVFVAGRHLEGEKGNQTSFELIVPGRYRWIPFESPQPVTIDGRLVAPGEVVSLDRGEYAARFVESVPGGMLVLAVDEPPGRAPLTFYQ
jgi:hypothetical protein